VFVPRTTYGFSGFSFPFISDEQATQQRELKPGSTILIRRAIPRLDRVVEGKQLPAVGIGQQNKSCHPKTWLLADEPKGAN
jgi:hypothetical protein